MNNHDEICDAYPPPAYFSGIIKVWCCGHDFMAGTVCSLPPGHDGPHAPICQICDGDWAKGECDCLLAYADDLDDDTTDEADW